MGTLVLNNSHFKHLLFLSCWLISKKKMGESFLFNIAESLLGKIASAALGELSLAHGLKADLTKLQSTLSNVKAVILDAEEQQLTNHEVCTWLAQLKEVLYEAEDVFDEFAYEALMNNIHGGINKKVRRFFSRSSNPIAFRLKMSSKVKEIREAFDEVAANKAKLHLSAHLVVNRPHWLKDREMTHSFVHAPEIIGRDRDRDVIVQSLTDSPQSLDENVSVVSIVGIGGLGKTALTKMVYNHARVAQHFEERVWICLGDLAEFNVNKVMVKLVKILSRGNNDSSEPELLQNCIRDYFKNKKFLLVLDDVWDVDRANWLELKNLLRCGVSGSKVVITTRNSSVASYMDSILTHKLEGLSHDKCVILFKKFAFRTGEDSQNLMEIGDEVVRKCQGVPLAVKTLGCLLFSKRSKNDWEYVRDNKIWKLEQKKDDILPALKLSYDQLPFVLKQCFVYCSVFPKDHEFDNIQLVQHWLAFGFLQSSNESTKFEDIGGQYINELCCRGFFQDFSHRDSIEFSFKMHDLIHDLALFVAQNEFENMYIGSFSDQEVYKGIRHVSFCERTSMVGKEVSISSTESSTKNGVMPTIWSMCFARNLAWNDQIVKQCMSMFNRTRLLDLSYCTLLEQLPDSIGTLKHLRYLNLNECWSLERLPDSISSLYNLQTLLLEGCDELQVLPKCTEDLINIRFLLITTKQKHLSLRFERLCSLQNLVFDRCENLECVFERTELDKLTSLRKLIISECKSLTSLFLPPIMTLITSAKKELTPLETLTIVGCPNLDLNSTCNDGISLPRLKSLVFSKLPQMESLPRWIFQGCASTLEFLKIEDCTNLTMLPEWIQSFTALKQLLIGGCPILSKRCKPGIGEDWPKIKHISKILLNGVLQLKQEDDDQLEEEDDDEEEEEDDEEEEDRDDHDDEEQEEEDEEEDDKEEEEEVYEYIRLQEAVSRRL